MGGATFLLEGDTRSDVERAVREKLREAEFLYLYEDGRTEPVRDSRTGKFQVILRVHS